MLRNEICVFKPALGGEGWGDGVGAYAASQTTVLHMKRLSQTDFRNFMCSLFPKAIIFDPYFCSTVAGVVPCGFYLYVLGIFSLFFVLVPSFHNKRLSV